MLFARLISATSTLLPVTTTTTTTAAVTAAFALVAFPKIPIATATWAAVLPFTLRLTRLTSALPTLPTARCRLLILTARSGVGRIVSLVILRLIGRGARLECFSLLRFRFALL